MSRVIRIRQGLVEEIKAFLQATGYYSEGMPISRMIEQVARIAMDSPLNSSEVGPASEDGPQLLKGKASKFFRQYDWDQSGEKIGRIPDELRAKLDEVAEEETREEPPPSDIFLDEPLEEDLEPPIPATPPWEALRRLSLEDAKLLDSRLDIYSWVGERRLRRLAAECALGTVPKIAWRTPKLMQYANDLLFTFTRWEELRKNS